MLRYIRLNCFPINLQAEGLSLQMPFSSWVCGLAPLLLCFAEMVVQVYLLIHIFLSSFVFCFTHAHPP